MRVLLTTDPIGGVWTFTKTLTAQLLERGHAVALVSFGRALTIAQTEWTAALGALHHGSFHCVQSVLPLEWMNDNHLASGGRDVIERVANTFAPDLIHTSQFCFGALSSDLPSLVTAHSDVLSWAAACHPGGLAPSPWLTTYRRIVQEGLSAADAITAPTSWMLDALRANFHLPATERVILNGRSTHANLSPAFRALQAVTSGRLWDPAKNLSLLREVKAPFPVLVAGDLEHDGTEADKNVGSAHLLGPFPEEALMQLFASSSIYIVTSRYEPFGLAPLEAALQGCAIVANDLPSLREVWGDSAIYYQGAGELTRLLAQLHDDRSLLHRSQEACRLRATTFTAARMTDEYLSLYQHLLRPLAKTRCRQELAAHAS